ncbi:MAG: hypothetical protein LUQ11_09965 [Methylococcaceae bacterium]|nr:hypothetical protein [Methylococcaceae bacterium]
MTIKQQAPDLAEVTEKLRLALKHKDQAVELESLDPLTQAKVNDQFADTELKKRYANWFIWILIGQLVAMDAIFIAVGIDYLHFQDSTHLNLFMGGTLAEVFGVVLVITRYLFSKK